MRFRAITTVFALLFVTVLAGCSVNNPEANTPVYTVSGTVFVPADVFAALQKKAPPTLLARMLSVLVPESVADVNGNIGGNVGSGGSYVPIPGVQIELVQLGFDVPTSTYFEIPLTCTGGCPVTAPDGSFTLQTTEIPSSDLALKVTFTDPVDGTPNVVMRALVYDVNVDVSPVSEATTQVIVEALSQFVNYSDFTVNEVAALVKLIEDENIDVSGLNFTDAVAKIRTEANDIIATFVTGFQQPGEMNAANPNDIFHLMELESRLVSPNATYVNGAMDIESSLGGAVSFDNNGVFQTGSAIYYWGLRSEFANDPVRLFDQALIELEQDPSLPAYQTYLTYGVPIGFHGIMAADNGLAVANSSTEKSSYGFISNDGGLMAFLSEQNDEGQLIYDRGLRVLMRKWKSVTENYNSSFNYANSTISYTDGTDIVNLNSANSPDLNPLLDLNTYNVVQFQNYLTSADLETGIGTGTWSFANTQEPVSGGSNATTKLHGRMTVARLDLDALDYQLGTGTVVQNAPKAMEPCPNLFVVLEGGSLMLRRDIADPNCNGNSAHILAGVGAVTSDGEVLIVPQTHDDDEDPTVLEFPIAGAGRRGWYIGVKQQLALSKNNVNGIYHVVGQITHLDSTTDTVTHELVHGNLQFIPGTGVNPNIVTGTLHKKSAAMSDVFVDVTPPALSKTNSVMELANGTYAVNTNGTLTFTLPGTTETVTGAAGQMLLLSDGRQRAMFIVLPVVTNNANGGSRGLLLLSHEFLVEYPVPPDPPGP